MFVYSLFLSLFAGNTNVVRISTRRNPQLDLVLEVLNAVLAGHPAIADRILVVRYGHDDAVTGFFSGLCDIRIIWGGNETVRRMRAIPIPAHATELAFSGKFSVAVLDAAAWLAETDRDGVAKRFCNDAFSFNQQGCACPKLVYWLGDAANTAAAGISFWAVLEKILPATGFAVEPAEAMDRLVAECSIALTGNVDGPARHCGAGLFTRLTVCSLADVSRKLNTGNGLFYEFAADSLVPLMEWFGCDDQTVSSYGIGEGTWNTVLREVAPRGICRVVQLGQALDFSPVWDGFDLVRSMCRIMRIEV
jgi:hypothetical protein